MTGLKLIVPLEDDSDDRGCRRRHKAASARLESDPSELNRPDEDDKRGHSEAVSSSSVLSNDLREQFETMKSVWRRTRRASNGIDENNEVNSEQVTDLKRKERETAVKTAIAVDKEMSHWKNGIEELEALLAAEDRGEDRNSDLSSIASSLISDDDGFDENDESIQSEREQEGQQEAPQDIALGKRYNPHPCLRFPSLPTPVLMPAQYDEEESEGGDTSAANDV